MVEIREFTTEEELKGIYPLIQLLNPGMDRSTFEELLARMCKQGYRCIGAFVKGECVGICGFWVGYRFWCHGYIDLDNIVVKESHRSHGIGAAMMRWIEQEGKRLGCKVAVLDAYTYNYASHRLYIRDGYKILGYHFVKDL